MKTILVVEDNEDMASLLMRALKKSYQTVWLKDGWETLAYLLEPKKEMPAGIVLDLMLPGRTGYELIHAIRGALPNSKIFIFSSHKAGFNSIPKSWVEGFFEKKDGIAALTQAIDHACGRTAGAHQIDS